MNARTRTLQLGLVVTVGLLTTAVFQPFSDVSMPVVEAAPPAQTGEKKVDGRTVYVVGKLSEEELISLTTALATAEPDAVLLIDTVASEPHFKTFFNAYRPDRILSIGDFGEGKGLEKRFGSPLKRDMEGKTLPDAFWNAVFPSAETVVVCPAQPRDCLLQAACLAGLRKAPLLILHDGDTSPDLVKRRVAAWKSKEVIAIGKAAKLGCEGVKLTELADRKDVEEAILKRFGNKAKVETLIVTNPGDVKRDPTLSPLGPWLTIQKRGFLLLTNDKGTNTSQVVRDALKRPALASAENLILLADLRGLPTEKRENPAVGKDEEIEMEPCTPTGSDPFTFATGRIFHSDIGVVALMMARHRLLSEKVEKRSAFIASNPGDSLPLLELFSRNTTKEFSNRGYKTTALYRDDVTKEKVRSLLPKQDIFLWEGHYKTLVEGFGFPTWDEPMRPSLVFLQSCLALNEVEALPVLQRGSVAVVGSSTRTFSGSGGAFTLAFFDAMLYEEQSLGGSLRQAKNFLLAYSMLKEKRLGDKALLGGANLRSAWAFTLWGDPTIKMPLPEKPENALPTAGHKVEGKTITLTRPEKMYDKQSSGKFVAQTGPNMRLAGLLTEKEDDKQLVPFLFAEVRLTSPKPNTVPRLKSKVNSNRWVFLWDRRLQRGYLIVIPPENGELRFDVVWDNEERS